MPNTSHRTTTRAPTATATLQPVDLLRLGYRGAAPRGRGVPRQAEAGHGGGPPCRHLPGVGGRHRRTRLSRFQQSGSPHRGAHTEELTLQSDPGRFFTYLGTEIANQTLGFDITDHLKVAAWCYRQAAEVHSHARGMAALSECYYKGRGVNHDPAQGAVWCQRAVDLGDAGAMSFLGELLLSEAGRGCTGQGGAGCDSIKTRVDRAYYEY